MTNYLPHCRFKVFILKPLYYSTTLGHHLSDQEVRVQNSRGVMSDAKFIHDL